MTHPGLPVHLLHVPPQDTPRCTIHEAAMMHMACPMHCAAVLNMSKASCTLARILARTVVDVHRCLCGMRLPCGAAAG